MEVPCSGHGDIYNIFGLKDLDKKTAVSSGTTACTVGRGTRWNQFLGWCLPVGKLDGLSKGED